MSSLARMLVVDDESQIRRFLRVALEAHAYEVVEAATGLEAIQKAATEEPDLIVLDLGLPDMDGKDVIARVREWSQTPILVLSVRQEEAEKVEALDAGAQDYVVKPFGIKELLARITPSSRSAICISTSPPTKSARAVSRSNLPARNSTCSGRSPVMPAGSSPIGRFCTRSGVRPTSMTRNICGCSSDSFARSSAMTRQALATS
jgi:CheY-like chemotaxis protein